MSNDWRMTRGTAWALGALGVLLLAGEFALVRDYYGRSPLASVECRATNAGVALEHEEVRVFVYPVGRPWELVADGHIRETLSMAPGRYDIRLLLVASADQQSEWFRDVELREGAGVVKHAAFSSGVLSVASGMSTAVATAGSAAASKGSEAGRVIVYVFSPENHDRIITSIRPAQEVVLAAGEYDLRAVYSLDSEERGVIWLRGVRVEAGGHATREVQFHRGSLFVTARNTGETLPSEAVTLTVYAAGDDQKEVVEWGRAGVPLSLERGRYDAQLTFALSNDTPSRWLRGLEIVEDQTLEQAVEFSSGKLRIDAELTGGEVLGDFDVYVYYYHAGDHREPVAYTPAGEAAVLESGAYDVRVHFFRSHDQPDAWFRQIAVEAGKLMQYTATFASGRLLVRAYDADRRELIGDDVFLYVHQQGAAGQRSGPIAVARSGEELILAAGTYDLRLVDTRAPNQARWLTGIAVQAGGRNELSVSF
jgi:hypothetical protein